MDGRHWQVVRPLLDAEGLDFATLLHVSNVALKVQTRAPLATSNHKLVLRGGLHHQVWYIYIYI